MRSDCRRVVCEENPGAQFKAAKDKLRIVREAVEDHDMYEAAVAAHARDLAAWQTKKVALEATEAATRAMGEVRVAGLRV